MQGFSRNTQLFKVVKFRSSMPNLTRIIRKCGKYGWKFIYDFKSSKAFVGWNFKKITSSE